MKTSSLITLILLTTLSFTVSADKPPLTKPWWKSPDTLIWTPLPNTLVGCSSTAGTYLDGKFYQICGYQGSSAYQYMQIYNGASWSQSNAFHPVGGVYGHSATVWNGIIVISGAAHAPTDFYNYTSVYDPGNNTWTQSTQMPYVSSFIHGSAMASSNNKCFLFGGAPDSGIPFGFCWNWTPGDTSMNGITGMPAPRNRPAAAECNGLIYVFGGRETVEFFSGKDTIWAYNPLTNYWLVKSAHLLTSRDYATAVSIGNLIFVIGGVGTSQNPLNSVEIYDTTTDTITQGTPLPIPSAGHASAGYTTENSNTSYTGHIYISGGSLGTGAYLGTVSGVYCIKVQPVSLGNLKALYH